MKKGLFLGAMLLASLFVAALSTPVPAQKTGGNGTASGEEGRPGMKSPNGSEI